MVALVVLRNKPIKPSLTLILGSFSYCGTAFVG
jgi:hypothetical protein